MTTKTTDTTISTPRVLLDQIAEHLGNLGDETSQILEMRIHVLTGKLGIGAVLTEPTPTPPMTRWAAFTGSAGGGEDISLHTTEREALEECINALGIDVLSTQDERAREGESEDEATDRVLAGLDDDTLRDMLQEHCDSGADDWSVREVQVP